MSDQNWMITNIDYINVGNYQLQNNENPCFIPNSNVQTSELNLVLAPQIRLVQPKLSKQVINYLSSALLIYIIKMLLLM